MAAAGSRGWTPAVAAFAATTLLALLAYGQTVASLARVWMHSDTFAHGFAVLPLSLFLVWRSRDRLASLRPRPYPLALLALIPLGLGWFVGRAASTVLVEQFCFVAMIPVLAVAHFGPRVARRLAFPLAFLFFAVPFGDTFQPRLMEITADFAEAALRWSGVPVSREGLYLVTTVSRWQVVESCSGLRYTIAGVVLATLFAHLCYRSNVKRAIFVASSVVVTILANGARAYFLILIGHLSDLRLGTGFDHRVYGWIIFTLSMAALFLAGSKFRDREAPAPPGNAGAGEGEPQAVPTAARTRWASFAVLSVFLFASWPVLEAWATSRAAAPAGALTDPVPAGAWVPERDGSPLWQPFFHGAVSERNLRYVGPGGAVQCYIAYYANQTQGRELLHQGNGIIDRDDTSWRILLERKRSIPGEKPPFTGRETVFRTAGGEMVVWDWYWLPDEYTTDPVRAKWLQARARLLGRPDRAAVVVLAAWAPEADDADRLLAQFCGDMLPSIRRSLRSADTNR